MFERLRASAANRERYRGNIARGTDTTSISGGTYDNEKLQRFLDSLDADAPAARP